MRVPLQTLKIEILELFPDQGEAPRGPRVGAQDIDAGGLECMEPRAQVMGGREPCEKPAAGVPGPWEAGLRDPKILPAELRLQSTPGNHADPKHPKRGCLVDEEG